MYELVSVIFPFADNSEKGKPRPGFIVSPLFGKHNQVIVAYVTTSFEEVLETDIVLDPSDEYFENTGLLKKSVLKLHRLSTFQPEALRVGAGFFPQELVLELKEKLKKIFEL